MIPEEKIKEIANWMFEGQSNLWISGTGKNKTKKELIDKITNLFLDGERLNEETTCNCEIPTETTKRNSKGEVVTIFDEEYDSIPTNHICEKCKGSYKSRCDSPN